MLITSLLPLLSRYSLGFDLSAGSGDTVTLTIIPRKAAGAKDAGGGADVRPISITASAAEIDEELGKGEAGALGQLIVARKSLADQLAEQRAATEAAKASPAGRAKAAAKPAAAPAAPSAPAPTATPATADPKPGEPASLW